MSNVTAAKPLWVFHETESVGIFLKNKLFSYLLYRYLLTGSATTKTYFCSEEMSVLCLVIEALFLRC